MSERLEAPLRAIVSHRTDERGVDLLTLSCNHVETSIGPASRGPDRKRCSQCAPVTRGQASSFIATGAVEGCASDSVDQTFARAADEPAVLELAATAAAQTGGRR